MGAVVIDAPVTSEVGFRFDGGLEGFRRVLSLLVVVDLGAKIVTMDDIIAVCSLVTYCYCLCVSLSFLFFGKYYTMRSHKLTATSIGNGTCTSMSSILMTRYSVALTSKLEESKSQYKGSMSFRVSVCTAESVFEGEAVDLSVVKAVMTDVELMCFIDVVCTGARKKSSTVSESVLLYCY